MIEKNNNLSSKLETSLNYDNTFLKIAQLLEKARKTTAQAINAFMTSTYWEIGRCIVEFEQNGADRAKYGEHDSDAKDMLNGHSVLVKKPDLATTYSQK